jgi:Kef-type K+ transport system membrane component KefB
MSGLDIFALIVLIVLALCGLAVWVLIAIYPGKIARQRNHPQADAISICGWWGALTLGILTPLAFIWAYTNPSVALTGSQKSSASFEAASAHVESEETVQ